MSLNPQLLVTALESIAPTKYSTVASLALLVYDHAITFDAEVMNVWNRPHSFGKILFIWTRYFGLSSLILAVTMFFHGSLSSKVCSGFFWWEAISIIVLNVSVEVILLARVYAVYNSNKKIIYGVAGVRLVALVGTGIIWARYLPPGLGLPPIDGLTGCYAPTASRLFGFSFVQSSLTEIVLCFCMLYKAWITYKSNYSSPLLKLLIEDSVIYFSSIFGVLLTNSLVFFIAPRGLVLIALGWEYAIPCTMGSRLLLSMFEQAFRQQTLTGQSRPGYLLSDIRTQGLSASASHVEPPGVLTMCVEDGD
ncbi:hypothetical protein JB92DRAFT_2893654 [Gautieria morchelliformis]|nr:hypothetical protein JB92DRAFT_2893654 [Gautieria morchelliformis]